MNPIHFWKFFYRRQQKEEIQSRPWTDKGRADEFHSITCTAITLGNNHSGQDVRTESAIKPAIIITLFF